ncbi:MAG: clostripain-related cysteine peptidase [Anaerolineae bacterium]|nr:clostripain-related cysteine peptidase [Anaerolineae bacterium]
MRRFALFILLTLLLSITPIFAQTDTPFTGTLDTNKPFYEYPILIEDDNTTLTADSQATSGDLDTIIYLLDETGNILAQNDNRTRDDLDAYLFYPAMDAGAYTLILARYDLDDGTTSGDFTLTISLTPTQTALPAYDLSADALAEAGYVQLEAQPRTEWTVLAYYGGDSDLEGSLITDLKEFELAGGGDDTVRIIAFLDRSPDYSDLSGDWTGAKILEITANVGGDATTKTLNSRVILELGEVDSGDGLTLARFMAWAVQIYPANRYALAFGGHGAGWAGVIPDYTAESIISLTELDHALKSISTTAPLALDLVINDACLMSSAEYHTVMARYFDMSFASPEVVVDPALDMTLFTTDLRQNPSVDNLPAIGTALIDQYINVDVLKRPGSDNTYMTNAITDLSKMGDLEVAINTFAEIVLADPLQFAPILGEARSDTYTYTAFRNGASLIDLGNFMRQVILLSTDDNLIASAQAVISALQAGRVYGNGGEAVKDRVLYQNIYFPEKAKNFDNAYFIDSPLGAWGEMLRAYYNALTPKQWKQGDIFHPPAPPQVFITNQHPAVPSLTNPLRLELEVIGRNVARGIFTADYRTASGEYERLSESPILSEGLNELGEVAYTNDWGSGVLQTTFEWEITLTELTDGTISRLVLPRFADETAAIEGRYRAEADAQWLDIIVIFGDSPDGEDVGIVTRVVSRDPNSDALAVVEIPDGAQFQVYRTLVSEGGQTQVVPDETNTFTWGNLAMRWTVPAPSGEYNLGFVIEAFGGAQSIATQPVTINNDNIAPNLRGHTDLVWGYTFVITENDWFEPTFFGDLNYEEVYYKDELTRLRIYQYQQLDETIEPNAESILATYGYTDVIQEESITINGAEKDLYTYTDGFVLGVGVLYETPDGAYLFVGIEYPENTDTDTLIALLTPILESFTQFDPLEIIANNTALWSQNVIGTGSGIGIGARYNLPITWSENVREDGIWVVASPQSDPNTFMRLAQLEAYDATVLRDAIIVDEVAPSLTNFTLTEKRVYYAQYNTWQVGLYTGLRDNTPVTGRVYATLGASVGNAYVLWQETTTESAPTLFSQVFEPMVDAISINKPFRSYPLTDYGFVFNYPISWGYMALSEENGRDILFARSNDGFSEYLVYLADTPDLQALANDWMMTFGYELVGDISTVTYNNKDGLRLEVSARDDDDDTLYRGYVFVTTSADGTKGVVFSIAWINAEPSSDVFDFQMNLIDYGVAPDLPVAFDDFTYARSWITMNIPEIGVNLQYPDSWGNMNFNNTFGVDRYASVNSPTGSIVLSIYYDPTMPLDELMDGLYNFSNVTLTPLARLDIGGERFNRYGFSVNYDDYTVTGRVLAFENPAGGVYVFELADYANNPTLISTLLDEFAGRIVLYQSGVLAQPNETARIGEVTQYLFDDLSIAFALPSNWDEPILDQEGLVYALSDDEIFGFYLYFVEEVIPFEDMAYLIGDYYVLEYADSITEFDLNGRDAVRVEYTFNDEGFAGVAFITHVDGRTLMFAIEGLSETDLSVYYDLLIQTVEFMDE